jgi:uncharacterized protein (DUF983 family)
MNNNAKAINPIGKGTKLYSVLKLKCPRCQEGNLFLNRNPYNLKMFDKMPDRCTVCGEDFVRESGFFWGAMMVSHALTTVIAVVVHIIVFHFYGWNLTPNIISIVSIILLLFPMVFRTSRAIWINIFVDYNPIVSKKKEL